MASDLLSIKCFNFESNMHEAGDTNPQAAIMGDPWQVDVANWDTNITEVGGSTNLLGNHGLVDM